MSKNAMLARNVKAGKPANQDQFADILLDDIGIMARPNEGEDQLFYNHRLEDKFRDDKLARLRFSIRLNSLLENIVVREQECDGKPYGLVAGERRFRSLGKLVAENRMCYDPTLPQPKQWKVDSIVICRRPRRFAKVLSQSGQTVEIEFLDEDDLPTGETVSVATDGLLPTAPASEVHRYVRSKVLRNCDDREALGISYTENREHEEISVAEQITLFERLVKLGLTQQEIHDITKESATTISHVLQFRTELPPEMFERLWNGDFSKSFATKFYRYDFADRPRLYRETVKVQHEEAEQKFKELREKMIEAEDAAEHHKDVAAKATKRGDEAVAEREKKKAGVATKKATAAKKKAKEAKESNALTEGHLKKAAARAGIVPRKAKLLSKEEMEQLQAKYEEAAERDIYDPECEKRVPAHLAGLCAKVVQHIIAGGTDPYEPIRDHMIEQGKWSSVKTPDPEDDDSAAEDFGDDEEPLSFDEDDDTYEHDGYEEMQEYIDASRDD